MVREQGDYITLDRFDADVPELSKHPLRGTRDDKPIRAATLRHFYGTWLRPGLSNERTPTIGERRTRGGSEKPAENRGGAEDGTLLHRLQILVAAR
jgi:hypothetical protein